jgi:MFS family permease
VPVARHAASVESSPAADRVVPVGSSWSPLRIAAFRALWLAQLGSMIGTWMQTVGAQWLLVDEPNASTLVSLVQTASLLPMLLLALPAGVLADSFDRRRLLVGVQLATSAVGAVLAGLALTGDMPPVLLLAFTFLLGAGAAISMPPWQALIPDIVPRHEVRAAAALGAVSMNLARAVGPALAGFLITLFPVGVVFAANAASYAAMAVVLLRWGPRGRVSGDVPERFVPALRAGARYVRHSPVVRRLLLRSALFVLPGTALWALLPLVANRRLGLGSGGYGLLLAALGIGAVAGAVALPRIAARVSTGLMVFVASLVYAAAQVGVVLVNNLALVVVLLLPAGAAWLAVLSTLGAATQVFLPGWVRARGLSMQQIVFMGGQAVGALAWGLVAQYTSLVAAFAAASVLMAVGAATVPVLPLHDTAGLDRTPALYWPEPQLVTEPDPDEGPVLITLTFTVPPENVTPFLQAMRHVRSSRHRTGASRWSLYRDAADPTRFIETFHVPSWEEHLRQHRDRLTGADQDAEEEALKLAARPPQVAHLFQAREPD